MTNKEQQAAFSYTDMAVEVENLKGKSTAVSRDILKTVSEIGAREEEKYGKPVGKYITLECKNFFKNPEIKAALALEAADGLRELTEYLRIPFPKRILVVGIGNILMTADALGPECCNKIQPVADENFRLCTLIPNVAGVTGIESFDLVYAAVKKLKPSLVIAIDSLAASNPDRLATTFQMSTAGLTPGGGVKNHRPALDRASIGVPVLAVGVPLVVTAYRVARTVFSDCPDNLSFPKNDPLYTSLKDMIVTVKDISVAVKECSDVIAEGIRRFSDKLKE
ncbi:MAG: GPR endopeptidase [Clostridiales bacterium]|jgi:spore protease|nr:GPR endopeptidase [Clostridiales bacterium]